MEAFIRAKNSARRTLLRWCREVEARESVDQIEQTELLNEGEASVIKIQKLYDDIILTCASDEIDTIETEREDCEIMYKRTKLKLLRLVTNSVSVNSSVNNSVNDTKLRLPEIKLPEFSGDHKAFMNFINKFDAVIHEKQISDSTKMEYLISCLREAPLRLLSHLTISDQNYHTARQLLKEKYQNTRKTVFSLVQQLCEQPVVTKPTDLEKMLDCTTGIYHALEGHGHPVEQGDSIFVYLMMQKLDEKTKTDFKQSIGAKIPSAKEFLHFVKSKVATIDQANDYEAPVQKRVNEQLTTNEQRTKPVFQHNRTSFQKRPTPPVQKTVYRPMVQQQRPVQQQQTVLCITCGDTHKLYTCPEFQKLTTEQRWQEIRNNNLCGNCLQPNHRIYECRSSACKECGKRHHTLLHRKETTCNNMNTQQ